MSQIAQRLPAPIKGAILAVLILLCAMASAVIDYTFFRLYAQALERDPGFFSYVTHRFGEAELEAELVAVSDFDPTGVTDRRELARNITAVYPAAPAGWTRRTLRESDFWRLRPELAHCAGQYRRPSMKDHLDYSDGKTNGCPMKPQDPGRAVVYEKGSRLLVLYASHEGRRGDGTTTSGKPPIISNTFMASYYNTRYPEFFRHRGMVFETLPRNSRFAGPVRKYPVRIYGWRKGAGTFRVFVVTNASLREAQSILMRLDYRIIDGLVDP